MRFRATETSNAGAASSLARFLLILAACVFSGVAAYLTTIYLQYQPADVFRFALLAANLLSCRYCALRGNNLRRIEMLAFAPYALGLSTSMVLGRHIVITTSTVGDPATASENYITPYGWYDVIALLLMALSFYVIALAIFLWIRSKSTLSDKNCCKHFKLALSDCWSQPIGWGNLVLLAALMFICWLPYLLAYWPGYIFGDTWHQLSQIFGTEAWNNHHPVFHTLIIMGCIRLANFAGASTTTGVALYSLVQMACMALGFAYVARWIVIRCRLAHRWDIAIALGFGISPAIANYSIAIWKDPLFSTALMLISVLLADLALSRGRVVRERASWLPTFTLLSMAASLLRNNGLYITVLLAIVLAALCIFKRWNNPLQRNGFKYAALGAAGIAVLCWTITGPIYTAIGIEPSSPEESLGIPINQMARVATYQGDMTDSDRAYLDDMLPLDLYPEVYRPCIVDSIKWDEHFNSEVLEHGFFPHWISLLMRNPRLYFESWEMQTYGFWAVNRPEAWTFLNIAVGAPANLKEPGQDGMEQFDIYLANKFGNDRSRTLFPSDELQIPVGIWTWIIFYLFICIACSTQKTLLIVLLPPLGLLATLLVASPMWYWPRYGAAIQFLVPFLLSLPTLTKFGNSPALQEQCGQQTQNGSSAVQSARTPALNKASDTR